MLALWLLSSAGCGDDPQSPEAQIRAMLARAETAAEERDIRTLRGLISERFEDGVGRGKDEAVMLLRGFLLRHRPLHVITRVQSITMNEHQQARVTLALATAGRPIDGSRESLGRIHGDLHRLELVLTRQDTDDWQILRAEREPAGLHDFF